MPEIVSTKVPGKALEEGSLGVFSPGGKSLVKGTLLALNQSNPSLLVMQTSRR